MDPYPLQGEAMKGKSLGRGLEEVSHLFLSSENTTARTEKLYKKRKQSGAFERDPATAVHALGVSGGSLGRIGIFALCNISIELARQGYRVLVVDDDPGRFNVTRLMGLMDVENFAETIFFNGPMGVRITYRTPFLNDLLSCERSDQNGTLTFWPERYRRFDFILFHLPNGRFGEMGVVLRRLSHCIHIMPTDRPGMLESYTAIKDLHQRSAQVKTGLVVYSQQGGKEASEAFFRMARNVKRFLNKDLVSYSFIQGGEEIEKSMEEGVPLVLKWPASEIRKTIYNVSGLLIEDFERRGRSNGKQH